MCRIYQSLLSCGGQEERSILSFKVRWQSWKAIIKSCEKFPIIKSTTALIFTTHDHTYSRTRSYILKILVDLYSSR